MTHPTHTFFFETGGEEGGEGRTVPTPPLGVKLATSPPRRDCGERTPLDGWAQVDPQPPPHTEGGTRRSAAPGKEGKRAGWGGGGGARAAGASSLLHCRGAIFPRRRPAGGLGPTPTTAPRAPPSRGATAPAAGSSGRRPAHMCHPRPPYHRCIPPAPQHG